MNLQCAQYRINNDSVLNYYEVNNPNPKLLILHAQGTNWPSKFLEAFKGLHQFDPYFGESFYNNSFHNEVDYGVLPAKIRCDTLFMKAKTSIGENGLLQGALSEEYLALVYQLIPNMKVEYFNCGHSIHTEKIGQFIDVLTR